jgi:hypothetical protein
MMCWVIGFENPADREKALPYAIDLGIALQLTNILRDIGEDLGRNRLYLPREDLRRFDYSEEDLRAHRRTPAFTELMRFQAARARSYYERGNAGIHLLDRRGRFAVEIASDVYREILNRIEASDFDVFAKRTVVPAARKYWITARAMALPMARRLEATLSEVTQISSIGALLGLAGQYLLHYLAGTPLLTDQIAEWIMARTPSRYAVVILEYLGPWAKPSAPRRMSVRHSLNRRPRCGSDIRFTLRCGPGILGQLSLYRGQLRLLASGARLYRLRLPWPTTANCFS